MPSLEHDYRAFVDLVARCRAAQKRYFRRRELNDLNESRDLERRVDAALRRLGAGATDENTPLFGEDDR